MTERSCFDRTHTHTSTSVSLEGSTKSDSSLFPLYINVGGDIKKQTITQVIKARLDEVRYKITFSLLWSTQANYTILSTFFQFLNAVPFTFCIFFPKCHLVIATRDRKDVAGERPANTPNHIREFVIQALFRPFWSWCILDPDQCRLVLS